jgi:hypothetical protein
MENDSYESKYEIAAQCAAHNAILTGTPSTWPIGEDVNLTVTATITVEGK